VNHPQIAAFARLAKENTPPLRKLEGKGTMLGRTMHDFAFDAIHDEIVVTNPFAQAILTFRGGARGEEAPKRIIQGPHTRIVSERGMDKVGIDPVNSEIYVATSLNEILVFPREANGDATPIRIIGGNNTRISGRPAIRIDPVRNLLLVAAEGGGGQGMLIFDRTAEGNVKPKAVFPGPSGNQFEIYNGYVIHVGHDSILAWSLDDVGKPDIRPRLKLNAPLGMRAAQTGIVLDPAHKEVIVGTGAGNEVRTFAAPELFSLIKVASAQGN
jgi:DNA-binding beta-propeller fold protein YncE